MEGESHKKISLEVLNIKLEYTNRTLEEMKEEIKKLNSSTPSLRQDVDLANTRTTEFRIRYETEVHGDEGMMRRITVLEKAYLQVSTIYKLITGVIVLLGLPTIFNMLSYLGELFKR